MTFTITGCVGMIGMNEHRVAVGINNLLGRTAGPAFTGRSWCAMLAQATWARPWPS
ncbi:MAG: hypothetical protein R3A10_21315 [Caldilineaceae bacterium]